MKKEIQEIPKKWLYHKDQGAKLFDLGEIPEGWVDSPAKLSAKEAVQISESQEIHTLSEDELPKHKAELSESLDHELGKVKPSKKKGK